MYVGMSLLMSVYTCSCVYTYIYMYGYAHVYAYVYNYISDYACAYVYKYGRGYTNCISVRMLMSISVLMLVPFLGAEGTFLEIFFVILQI